MTAKSHSISVNGAENIHTEHFIMYFTGSEGAKW